MQFRSFFLFATMLLAGAAASAHESTLGDISIKHPTARATVPGQPSGAAYLTIENHGKSADKLISAESPAAKSVQIHTMSMDGNVMKMREVASLPLPPSSTVSMKPGDGYHIMLIGLKQALKPGDQVPLALTFEKAGKISVMAKVEEKGAASAGMNHDNANPMHK